MNFKPAWPVATFFFMSGLAHAYPAVGDYVRYEGTFENKGVVWELQLTKYDAATQKFMQIQTTLIDGEAPDVQETWVTAKYLPTPANMQDMLAHCGASGGTLETVTVKAGTFPSCRLPVDPDGFSNVGAVPFGTISGKWTDADSGKPATMELSVIHPGP